MPPMGIGMENIREYTTIYRYIKKEVLYVYENIVS